MRYRMTLGVAALVALAASTASAVEWWETPTCVTAGEPQHGDFRVPMNNAWGGSRMTTPSGST